LTKRTHLSASQVLASRYYLTIVFMLVGLPLHGVQNYITVNNILLLIILAIIKVYIESLSFRLY